MATKSFYLKVLKFSAALVILAGCQNFGLKTRDEINKKPQQGEARPIDPQTGKELPPNQPKIEKPEFLEKEAPKLGLILGPGGALSFAQIGFLQALEDQKIKVHGIAGIEWGAIVAAAYAMDKKAHSIEWKLLKLPGKKFQPSGGFFSGGTQPQVGDFSSYLTKVYGRAKLSESSVPFACSALDIENEKSEIYSKGSAISVLKTCWPSAPHFKLSRYGADFSAVARLASYLRQQGANLIVYVDVAGPNELLDQSIRNKDREMAWALLQTKSLGSQISQGIVDKVVRIPVSGEGINSYNSLRSIIRKGQLKSKSLVKGMAQQYAY